MASFSLFAHAMLDVGPGEAVPVGEQHRPYTEQFGQYSKARVKVPKNGGIKVLWDATQSDVSVPQMFMLRTDIKVTIEYVVDAQAAIGKVVSSLTLRANTRIGDRGAYTYLAGEALANHTEGFNGTLANIEKISAKNDSTLDDAEVDIVVCGNPPS